MERKIRGDENWLSTHNQVPSLSLPSLQYLLLKQISEVVSPVKRIIHRFNKIAMPPRRTGRRSNSAYKKGDYVEVS